jgi:2-polyprenyl-3-methyl-5-hydroxy-6-metoxy-1,4-benzoquinol methylase
MPFEDVMATVLPWLTATEALAALGAQLTLQQSDEAAPPEIVEALQAVSAAAGLVDLDELPPPQQATVAALVRTYLRTAADLLDNPSRSPGWSFTDPDVLDGWGRGSMMVPAMLASGGPGLQDVSSFLDVGTGVGLLAVAAAGVWPNATIVGIDPWEPSLARARENVKRAGLDDRISLRCEDVADLAEVDQYDCAWIPSFFLTEPTLVAAVPKITRAVRPEGWIALGRMASPPDPLTEAVSTLRTVRSGGWVLETKDAIGLLEEAGCVSVHPLPREGLAPLEFIVGQKPVR